MRVTDNMKYYSAIRNMNGLQQGYNELLEKLASQKRINRPSDDPSGLMNVLDFRQTLAVIDQYKANIDRGNTWLSMTETTLTGVKDLLLQAKECAVSYQSATPSLKLMLTNQLKSLREQICSLANASQGGNYLFAGSRVGTKPFSKTLQAAQVETGVGTKNVYSRTLLVNGAYQGVTNKTYVVKITDGGVAGSATYQLSTDGGKTWGTPSTAWDGSSIVLDANGTPGDTADDLVLAFEGGQAVGADDIFYVNAYSAGYYRGDGLPLSLTAGHDNIIDYNIPGEGIFVPKGGEGIDVFQVLSDLESAMEGNDLTAIGGLINDLTGAREQVEQGNSLCGTKQIRLEMAQNQLTRLDKTMTDLLAAKESVNTTELAMLLSMKKVALDATYALSSKLEENTILNFLR